ncbi:hypothetical protein Pmani_002754 [Petrolisthes manimaculis]|uniref:EGF-like domain-containing protein n=1 Tax=Petrolisthes manimaculis TaxID=1843537 RepID=A0AAE1UN66_9EUCA|nr:hypothetical protein Pmani_002754 [Petrolisthes manimaculis]
MKPIQKHVGSQVSGVGQSSGSVKISTTASILPNDTECEDIDECTPPGIYSQKCTNGKGFYRCSCSEGYTLDTDKKTCKATNHSLAYLVISNHRSILTADLNQRSLERVPVLVENVVATASDMKSGEAAHLGANRSHAATIFDPVIRSDYGSYSGRHAQIGKLVGSGLDLVEGLAYDWITGNLYWVDSGLIAMEVSRRDGSGCMVLLNKNISQPRGLSIDPFEGSRWLFWTDWVKQLCLTWSPSLSAYMFIIQCYNLVKPTHVPPIPVLTSAS